MRSSLYQTRRKSFIDSSSQDIRKHRPDYALVVLTSILLVWGAVIVYAIGPGLTQGTSLPTNYFSSKQLVAVVLGVIAFAVATSISLMQWKKMQYLIIGAAAIVAVAVRFVGEEINGAHRWIQIGGFSFQAAELIKLALVLWLAYFLSKRVREGTISQSETVYQLGAVIVAVVFVVAGLQSDLGSAAVMLAIIGVMAFVAGLPMKRLGVIALIVILLGAIAIGSSQYRRDRVTTFLNPTSDCQNEGYQACQALITVGSGGLLGKGVGRSVQAYGYLPEPANDSIFAIVSEKFGFIGASVMVGIFWILFRKIELIARGTKDLYTQLLVVGVLVWLSIQTIINIAAMLGLIPLKGITLPFVSYGGTSIIFVMIAMGIVFAASRYTDLSMQQQKDDSSGSKTVHTNSFEVMRRTEGGRSS